MENLIRDIIELDKKKRLELEQLENEKKKIGSFLREKRQEIENKYKAEAEEKLSKRRSEINQIISQAKEETEIDYKRSLNNLEQTFEKHHDEWIDTLYQYCINDDQKDESK